MSLKSELEGRGVKLATLAKELEEAYGNLYTALQMEAAGKEIRHKAVLVRVQKVRDWLAQSHAEEVRVSSSVEAVGNRAAMAKRFGTSPHAGHTVMLTAKAGERVIECGDVLSIREGDDTNRYRFLRVVQNAAGSVWADIFGPLPVKETSWAPHMRSRRLETLGLELTL